MAKLIFYAAEAMKILMFAEAFYVLRRYLTHRSARNAKKSIPLDNDTKHAIEANNADEEVVQDNASMEIVVDIDNIDKINKVIFFPDKSITIRDSAFESRMYENRYEELSKGPFKALMTYLRTTQHTFDVCLYVLSFAPLARLIADLHASGVKVRLIIDSRENEAGNSQARFLAKKGVEIKSNEHSWSVLMHHKFVIIDNKMLLNGSFNWKRAAILYNFDNVMVTATPEIVSLYAENFNRMWSTFKPYVTVSKPSSRTNKSQWNSNKSRTVEWN